MTSLTRIAAASLLVGALLDINAFDADSQAQSPTVPATIQEASKEHSKTFDAGEISLDEGPGLVEHDFRLLNPTDKPVEVLKIVPTCGCLKATLDKHRIEPGEVAILHLAEEVQAPGELKHGATLMLADGTAMSYRLRTVGVISLIFSVILHDPVVRDGDKERRVPVRFLMVDSREDGVEAAPVFDGPPGVTFTFDGWTYLERRSSMRLRPTRQVGVGMLDFSQYSGEYPMSATFRTPRGPVGKIQVFDGRAGRQ